MLARIGNSIPAFSSVVRPTPVKGHETGQPSVLPGEVGRPRRPSETGDLPSAAVAAPNSLTPEEKALVQQLRVQDRKTRSHEQAHLAVAGRYATGGPQYQFVTGPDGCGSSESYGGCGPTGDRRRPPSPRGGGPSGGSSRGARGVTLGDEQGSRLWKRLLVSIGLSKPRTYLSGFSAGSAGRHGGVTEGNQTEPNKPVPSGCLDLGFSRLLRTPSGRGRSSFRGFLPS